MRKPKNAFEISVQKELQNDLADAMPDVWAAIAEQAPLSRESAQLLPEEFPPQERVKKSAAARKRFHRAAAIAAAAFVLVAGLAISIPRIPLLLANADTLYDEGGHLNNTDVPAPSAAFIQSYNGFGLNLLRKLCQCDQSEKNVFISPASITIALGMTANGAKGQTADEFRTALNVPDETAETFNQNCLALQSLITGSDRFKLANSLWLSNACQKNIRADFLNTDKRYFGASVNAINFLSTQAAAVLNQWVLKNTGNRINPHFKTFKPNTVMKIINTIYFKSGWTDKFTNVSKPENFQTPQGAKSVQYMSRNASHYFENRLLQGIVLPYNDKKTSMLILLPKTNLTGMLGKLTAADLSAYVKQNINSKAEIDLTMPYVRLQYTTSLNKALKELGLHSAFDSGKADFGAMTKDTGNLCISDVEHITYLNIDKTGTEAAAATNVGIISSFNTNPKTMDVNRPFLTAIVNNDTGAILFLGAITDPTAK